MMKKYLLYTGVPGIKQGDAIMNRYLSYSIEAFNEERKRQVNQSAQKK
jgi:hypothetical protein